MLCIGLLDCRLEGARCGYSVFLDEPTVIESCYLLTTTAKMNCLNFFPILTRVIFVKVNINQDLISLPIIVLLSIIIIIFPARIKTDSNISSNGRISFKYCIHFIILFICFHICGLVCMYESTRYYLSYSNIYLRRVTRPIVITRGQFRF